MIRAALEKLVLALDECRAVILVAPDGVVVDSIVVDETVDSEVLAASIADLLVRSDQLTREAGPTPLEELALTAGPLMFMARSIGSDYRLLAVIGSDCDFDRARQELRYTASFLLPELAVGESDGDIASETLVDPGPTASL